MSTHNSLDSRVHTKLHKDRDQIRFCALQGWEQCRALRRHATGVYKWKSMNRPLTCLPTHPFLLCNHQGAWPISISETSSNLPFLSVAPACTLGNPSQHSPQEL